MDAGLAAVVAGGFGLVGTLLGGVAAAWGGSMAATRTAAAARQQALDQAVTDHAHWLRQQRLEAYEGLLGAYDEMTRALAQAGEQAADAVPPNSLRP